MKGGGKGDAGSAAGGREYYEGGEGDAKAAAADAGGGGVGAMKSGDYMIHVFIEKAKEIKVPGDSVDPMFEVTCLGQTKYSEAKDDILGDGAEVVWGEHIFIEPRGVDRLDAEAAKLKIRLLDQGFFKDALLGEFDFDLSYVYFMDKHLLSHKWLALNNPGGDDYATIQAYVKVSISVSAEGDDQVEITDDTALKEDPDVLMSPSLNPTFYQIKISVLEGQELPMMDQAVLGMGDTKIDAFMQFDRGKKKLKTNVVRFMEKDPPAVWNKEFWIPAQTPVLNPVLYFKLMDEDVLGNELAATTQFYTKELLDNMNNGRYVWKNMYGAPQGASVAEYRKLMNENPEFASEWRGRVLFHIAVEESEKPLLKVVKMPEEAIEAAKEAAKDNGFTAYNGRCTDCGFIKENEKITKENEEKIKAAMELEKANPDNPSFKIGPEIAKLMKCVHEGREYAIIAQVGQAVALPDTQDYKVKITVGGYVMDFKPFPSRNKVFYKRYDRKEPQIIKMPYVDCRDFGKVIVQLIDEAGKPVSYFIDDVDNYLDPDPHLRWRELRVDKSVGAIEDPHMAGILSFKLSLHDVTNKGERNDPKFGDKKAHPGWNTRVPRRSNPVKVRAYIYSCRDLPAADATGTSDPYLVVWDTSPEEEKVKTQVVEDNNNPLFYEVLELNYEVFDQNDLHSYPPFIFDVYDYDDDLFDTKPDFLGRCLVEAEDCALIKQEQFERCKDHGQKNCDLCADLMLDIPHKPRWHPVKFAPGLPRCGEILVSFAVVEHDYSFNQIAKEVDLRKTVEFMDFDVDMLILGLRGLQSPGILPVKKAFINFNIKSLVPPNGPAVNDIATQPQSPGSNPTLNTTVSFNVPLPTDPLFCPKLSCTVYDYIFKGWTQPIIGVFTIPFGQIMVDLIKERREETDDIKVVLATLQDIIEGKSKLPKLGQGPAATDINGSGAFDVGGDDYSASASQAYSGRSIGAMDPDIEKANQKSRAKAAKKLGKDENLGQYREGLGANEQEGNDTAKQRQAAQLQQEVDYRESLISQRSGSRAGSVRSGGGTGSVNSKAGEKLDTARSGGPGSKKEVMKQLADSKNREKRVKEDERLRALEQLNQNGDDGYEVIVMPKYAQHKTLKVDKEVDPPPDNLYIGCGWDEDSTTKRKHYRQFAEDELENNTDIFPPKPAQCGALVTCQESDKDAKGCCKHMNQGSPFDSYKLLRGQSRGAGRTGGMFSFAAAKKDASGQASDEKVAGKFKGLVMVESREAKERYAVLKEDLITQLKDRMNQLSLKVRNQPLEIDVEKLSSLVARRKFEKDLRQLGIDHLQISQRLCNLESEEILKRSLLVEKKCCIRLYAVSGFNMASRDNGSASDTYLFLTCNGKEYNERDIYQLDEPNPTFYKSYDFDGVFPGSTPLKIEVWDYDMIFGDELIGTTNVDLEDRFFSIEWQSLADKPIEYRELMHPSSALGQGTVKCWVEINRCNAEPGTIRDWDITEKPPTELEVRVCVLNCVDIPCDMDIEGTSDVYFRTFFDTAEEVQETDTHFRCTDGKPDFRYRLVYGFKVPNKNYRFTVQCFDKDFFSKDNAIGSTFVDLESIILDTALCKKPLNLNKKYFKECCEENFKERGLPEPKFDKDDDKTFWVQLWGEEKDANDKKTGKQIKRGTVRLQVDVVPLDFADKNKVGKAREGPNHSPSLPAPEGRFELSINPFKMLAQMVGPALRRKIMCGLCCLLCLALIVPALPTIMANVLTGMILG